MPNKSCNGLQCPKCKHGVSYIHNSRGHGTFVRRHRRCVKCNHSWTTHEVAVTLMRGRPKDSGGEMDMATLDEIRKSKQDAEYVEPDDFDDED